MARPGDEIAAGAGGRSHLRPSPAERERAVDVLKAAFVQGRLTKEEFDQRISQALVSQTHAGLVVLTIDIPAWLSRAQLPQLTTESQGKKALGLRRRTEVVIGLALAAASMVTSIVIHQPVTHCSYLPGPPPPGCTTSDYPMTLRVGIVLAGFIVAGLILAAGRYAHRHRS